MEGCSPVDHEVVGHILTGPCVLPAGSGLDISASKLPGLDSFWTEDVSVDLFEFVPLKVGSLRIEGVCWAAVIEARNGFHERSASSVGFSSLLVVLIGLVGAVTGVGLVRPLSEWDRRDSAPSRGREGYIVSPKRGERVVDVIGG